VASDFKNLLDLSGRTAIVTGGYGVLGGSMARALGGAGARVAILGRRKSRADDMVAALKDEGIEAIALIADALDRESLEEARKGVLDAWGRIDILINAAGGNVQAARSDATPVFDIPFEAFDEVVRLNLHATVYPSMVFGSAMAESGRGCIVNISSMAAMQAISGVMGYSAAKAAIDNVTRWLAVDLARKHGGGLRVNAIAPGFFIADQNRAVLIKEDGSYTDRARTIVLRTPMGRFGEAHELQGPVLWLCSDAASFVTGTVIPVDGGFSAFSGV
jgi:NAD(P)-dependent dehydrogenase (short-subunit alcohol dehydrogenase family)